MLQVNSPSEFDMGEIHGYGLYENEGATLRLLGPLLVARPRYGQIPQAWALPWLLR